MRTLVLGGIRSGKSRWAEEAIADAARPAAEICYIATGSTATDDAAWPSRVAAHRDRRPTSWTTVEDIDVATRLRQQAGTPTLVDDIGNWLTATMDRRNAWGAGSVSDAVCGDVDALVAAVDAFDSPLVLVSPEVGLTVVPATPSGRQFADALGSLNQRLAAACERVVLVIAGLAVPIKAERMS